MATDTPFSRAAIFARSGLPLKVIGLAIAAVFALDCLTPLGFAIPFLYLPILWVALPRASSRQRFGIVALILVLTAAGLFISPGGDMRLGLANRALTLLAVFFMLHSASAHQKAVNALHERERELTDLVENAPVGIHWIAQDGEILWANQQELDLLGYGREEYIGRNIVDFHVDRKTAEDALHRLGTTRLPGNFSGRLRHKDGSLRHVLISSNAHLGDGLCVYSRCFTQDITDRIRAELANRELEQLAEANARLRESEARLNFSLRISHTAGWSLDLVDHTLRRAQGHDCTFGYTSVQPKWTFNQFLEHVLPEDRAEVEQRFRAATEAQTDWNFECRIRRVDGEVRWIWVASEHQRDETGQMRRMAGILQDITERKSSEQALHESRSKLNLAFEDRESLSRDLHDNVIQRIYAVGLQLEVCQRSPHVNPTEVTKHLAHAVQGLNGVIRDLRGYISYPAPQVLRRSGLHAELASLVETMNTTGTLRFRFKVDSWAIARLAPPQAAHVLNIAREALSNTLRHSRARQARLLLQGTQNGTRLKISDDGVGFDPVTARQHAGGLRNLAARTQQIGGRLEVSSSPGKGATLVLHIPNGAQTDGI